MEPSRPLRAGLRRRRFPSFADLALIMAIVVVLALSWRGLPDRPDPAATAPAALGAPAPK